MLFTISIFQPKVVSDADEMELAKQLERLEEANREVAGDDDADSMEEEDSEPEDSKSWAHVAIVRLVYILNYINVIYLFLQNNEYFSARDLFTNKV